MSAPIAGAYGATCCGFRGCAAIPAGRPTKRVSHEIPPNGASRGDPRLVVGVSGRECFQFDAHHAGPAGRLNIVPSLECFALAAQHLDAGCHSFVTVRVHVAKRSCVA